MHVPGMPKPDWLLAHLPRSRGAIRNSRLSGSMARQQPKVTRRFRGDVIRRRSQTATPDPALRPEMREGHSEAACATAVEIEALVPVAIAPKKVPTKFANAAAGFATGTCGFIERVS